MNIYKDLRELLEDEIKKIVKKGDITPHELESVYKAIDVIKDIEMIEGEQDGGMSYGYSRDYSGRDVYGKEAYSREGHSMRAYSRDGMSNDYGGNSRDYSSEYSGADYSNNSDNYSNRNRDTRGRYSRNDGNSYAENSYGYSRSPEREQMIKKLEQMLNEAQTERERDTIMRCIQKLEA